MRWLDGIIDSMDMSSSKLGETVKDKKDRHVAVHRVAKSQTKQQLNNNKSRKGVNVETREEQRRNNSADLGQEPASSSRDTQSNTFEFFCRNQWLLGGTNVKECVYAKSLQSVSDSLCPYELQPAKLPCPRGFSRQECWSGLPCPPSGDLPTPGIEPRSASLQADSLPYIFNSKLLQPQLLVKLLCVCVFFFFAFHQHILYIEKQKDGVSWVNCIIFRGESK